MHKIAQARAIRSSKDFKRKLEALLIDLAQQIVRDGEGAEKFVEIRVTGAAGKKAAQRIGLAIGNSPLVKTALAAGDANWGRIVMAVGKSGEKVDRDTLSISVGGIMIAAEGGPVPGYDEAPVSPAHGRPRDPDRGRYRPGQGQGHGLDLRPDPSLHRHQRQLPLLSEALPIILVSAVALVDTDGRVLLARRPPGKAMAGLWEFPGGKVEPGETPEAALIRELKEELGIDTKESCLAPFTFASHAYEKFHLLMPLYVCRRWNGTVTAQEGQELAWARAARLGDYEMPPADKPLVAMLRDLL